MWGGDLVVSFFEKLYYLLGDWMSDMHRIPTNLRTLLIFEAIAKKGESLTPTEIGRLVNLPKQTIHRLCATLVEEGFLVYEPDGKRLRAGRRTRALSSGLLHASKSHLARHQVLVALSQELGETINFVVPEENGMHYQDRIETDWAFRIQLPVGTNVPFHCTASGKTFLASLTPAKRKKLVGTLNLEKLTPNTFDEPAKLLEELKWIGKNGYAIDREEFVEGMVAIAVPVIDPDGRYCASVAFHGPVQRISIESAISKVSILQAAAEKLSEVIFD